MYLKQLPAEDLARCAELDRSEDIPQAYFMRDGHLALEEVDWHAPDWPLEGPDDFSIQGNLKHFMPILEHGGILLGAFEGERLLGMAVLRPDLTEDTAQLAFLIVAREARSRGVGKALTEETLRLAKEAGAVWMYVSATPTRNTVDFYMRLGFELAAEPHPELFALEPEDIHMLLKF